MSRAKSSPSNARAAILALAATTLLGACTDMYLDRRDTVSFAAGDAVAANKVAHMVDPWPPYSGNRNIAFNGERMGCAVERYRHNTVIQPRQVTTSSAGSQSSAQGSDAVAPCAAGAPQAMPSAAAAAPQGAAPAATK